MSEPNAYPIEYVVTENITEPFDEFNPSLIVKRKEYKKQSWAIYPYYLDKHCYNQKTKRFDWEPQPSDRTEGYLKTHRFETAEEAIEVAKKIIKEGFLV